MSALVARGRSRGRSIVAFHGGPRSAAYFDCPGHPAAVVAALGRRQRLHRGGTGPAGLRRVGALPRRHGRARATRRSGLRRGRQDPRRECAAAPVLFLLGHSAGCELGGADGRRRAGAPACSGSNWPAPDCGTAARGEDRHEQATATSATSRAARAAVAARRPVSGRRADRLTHSATGAPYEARDGELAATGLSRRSPRG